MAALQWMIVLLSIAALLVGLELVIPSGGLLAILAGISAIGGLLFAFRHSPDLGWLVLIGLLLAIPALLALAVRLWPRTWIGRRMLIDAKSRVSGPAAAEHQPDPKNLVGRIAQVRSGLMPSGMVELDGVRYEAFTDEPPISKGALVRIVRWEMGRLLVAPSDAQAARKVVEAGHSVDHQLLLGESTESLGIDSLEDPPR